MLGKGLKHGMKLRNWLGHSSRSMPRKYANHLEMPPKVLKACELTNNSDLFSKLRAGTLFYYAHTLSILWQGDWMCETHCAGTKDK